jgi:hypothetical protein
VAVDEVVEPDREFAYRLGKNKSVRGGLVKDQFALFESVPIQEFAQSSN